MEWGPEINHGGKRLPGMEDAQAVSARGMAGEWFHTERGCRANCLTWDGYDAVRLPADHPYYATTPRTMTADEAYKRFYEIWHDTPKTAGEAATELLRELGLIREETALERYFAANPMTVSERDAVTAYASWAEENA